MRVIDSSMIFQRFILRSRNEGQGGPGIVGWGLGVFDLGLKLCPVVIDKSCLKELSFSKRVFMLPNR